jgi:Stage II sporulation protein E (SpoIIE)/GAF domain
MARREANIAVQSAAGLYVVGATLTATAALLPRVESPAGVAAVAALALLTAAGLLLVCAHDRAGPTLAWAADMWGIVLIALLCASAGGASSPFALIYFFAVGHAAAFQQRDRFLLVCLLALVAFLVPLTYTHVSATFAAVACVGIVSALLASGALHLALGRARDERWRLEFLIAATANLDTSLDPPQALRRIALTAVPELAELCVIDLIDPLGTITETVAAAVDADVARGVERMRREYPLDLRGTHPVARVLETKAPEVVDDLRDSAELLRAAQSDEHQDFMRAASYSSAAVFPMIARGRLLGVISFLHLGRDVRYGAREIAVLEDLTGRAALAFDNARLYAERAHVAHTLRRGLMPVALPTVPGLELASYFRPMDAGNEVGGDFYDVFDDGASCWLVIGDVCGKGAEAAALTAFLRHTTVAYARERAGPARVLSRVNDAMLEQDFEGRFATAILARLQLRSSEAQLTLAVAGHPAALIMRAGGHSETLGVPGTLLGVFPETAIEEVSTVLARGDSLTLYTDGLSDAHAPGRTVSTHEMVDQLQRAAPRVAQETINALLELVDLNKRARDDLAILCARVTGRRD